jgi:hypothetical protein
MLMLSLQSYNQVWNAYGTKSFAQYVLTLQWYSQVWNAPDTKIFAQYVLYMSGKIGHHTYNMVMVDS